VNEKSRRAHRREAFWQIVLPVIVGVILAAVLVFLLVSAGPAQIERSAQIAVILLMAPLLAVGIGLLVSVALLTGGINKLIEWLPERTYLVQRLAEGLNRGTRSLWHVVNRPFVTLESWGASINKLVKRRG
jgi:predicted PurR-regulated permease PerM